MSLTIDSLTYQGRNLLSHRNNAAGAYDAYDQWIEDVTDWLTEIAPGTGFAAEWQAMPDSPLGSKQHVLAFPGHHACVRDRLLWLSTVPTKVAARGRPLMPAIATPRLQSSAAAENKRVFIVHGRDDAAREAVARFLERLELKPVILHEQPNGGRTIIEKFEQYANVSFAIVLLTGDDIGGLVAGDPEEQKRRARQNVILELGFFLGALGRSKVLPLYSEGIELPSDYDGVAYVPFDSGGAWRMQVVRELKAAGFRVDANSAF